MKLRGKKKVFVSYLDDNDTKVNGFFDNVKLKSSYVILQSGKNKITLPSCRVKKIKEELI